MIVEQRSHALNRAGSSRQGDVAGRAGVDQGLGDLVLAWAVPDTGG